MENLHQEDHRIMLVHVAELPSDFDEARKSFLFILQ